VSATVDEACINCRYIKILSQVSRLHVMVRNVRGMHGEGAESYALDIRSMRLKRTDVCHGVEVQYHQSLQCQCLLSHIMKLAANKRDRNEWFGENKKKLCQIL
jgi:hypothetical protein